MRCAPVFSRVITIAALVVIVDQVLKAFARGQLAACILPQLSSCEQEGLVGPVRLIRLQNAGSALGFLQGLWIWVLIAVLGLVILPFIGRRVAGMGRMATLALGLQVGGALANLLDRTLMGSVTDFIDVGLGVVFNPADVALMLGAFMLGIPFAIRAWSPASAGPADAQKSLVWKGAGMN
jgi:signal peptidase II